MLRLATSPAPLRHFLATAVGLIALVTARLETDRVQAADPPASSPASVSVFDFETDAEIGLWHDERRTTLGGGKSLERVPRFVTSGASSLLFRSPAWKQGRAEWPAFECRPPITDWTGFDRLMFDVTNASGAVQHLGLFISDSQKPTRHGLAYGQKLEPRSHTRVVLDLAKGLADRKLDPADIHVMHFFTERPPTELILYIDGVRLLKTGQPLPPLPDGFLTDFAALQATAITELRTAIDARAQRLRQAAAAITTVGDWLKESLATLAGKLDALDVRARQGGAAALDLPRDLKALRDQLDRLEALTNLRVAFEPMRTAIQPPEAPRSDVVLGLATSMEKVLPRCELTPLKLETQVAVSLARGERESVQLVLIPCRADLKQIRVQATDLRAADGAVLSAQQVKAPPVGYVETRTTPPYGSSCVGWWPDPILEFLSAADVARGDAQSFWVRVHAPRDQAAGEYHGRLQIHCADGPLFDLELKVRVYAFAVPKSSPLPLAVTFGPHDHPTAATRDEQTAWRSEPDYPINAWKKHRLQWADFLADYYLTYDSLYTNAGPDFEAIQRLHRQGRLGCFNLGYYGPCGASDDAIAKWKQGTLTRLRRQYEQAKALGLLDHAYIYGCDENPRETFPDVQRAAAMLKAEFPDVLVMTTTYDHSYGQDTEIKAIDAWCPLTPRFDPANVAVARAAGRSVWWYICCGPHHPPANMFIEYPAIEGRLLMGPMTAKYRPDGFLYYQISIWNSRRPITAGPLTDWDPRSWTSYHGDGSWTCVGPDGTPLPTIRLENFRDGLEDYAYFCLLEHLVRQVESAPGGSTAAQQAWLTEARAALPVPETLVKSIGEYSRDPAQVYAYRNRLAELIERAGVPDADPWAGRAGTSALSAVR